MVHETFETTRTFDKSSEAEREFVSNTHYFMDSTIHYYYLVALGFNVYDLRCMRDDAKSSRTIICARVIYDPNLHAYL